MNYSFVYYLIPASQLILIIDRRLFRFHRLAFNFIQRQARIAQLDKAPDVVTLQLSALEA